VFIEVLKDRSPRTAPSAALATFNPESLVVDPGATSGDYLTGFLLGTRSALYEKNRESLTVTVPEVSASSVAMLIALFERAVGLYASLINVNAYHQPGVEAGKKAAAQVLKVQEKVVSFVAKAGRAVSVDEIADGIGEPEEAETVFKLVRHLAANERMEIQRGASIFEDRYLCS
jgi:glucose-6-phosphate isomerase